MNKQQAGGRKDGYARTPGLTGILFIHVVMSMAHRLTCKKLRVLSRLRRSQPAPNIRNPAPLRTH